jgi:FliI/YscN family ATPase
MTQANRTGFIITGRVIQITGPILKCCLPGSAVGDLVEITSPTGSILGLVTSYIKEQCTIACFNEIVGVRVGTPVKVISSNLSIEIPANLLGLILTASGEIIDGKSDKSLQTIQFQSVQPSLRNRSTEELVFRTGISIIDNLLTVAEGQRLLICAEAGVGKTELITQLSDSKDADVVVFALIGERSREAKEFFTKRIDKKTRDKSVIIISTSDETPLKRVLSAQLATAISEKFARGGKRVLLLFDSLTRYIRAERDLALAAGELPVRRGYPASVFSALPKLLERTGKMRTGSITAFYTLLLSSELEEQDPMIEEVKSILDGHLILRKKLSEQGIFPAISIPESLSRMSFRIQNEEQKKQSLVIRRLLARLHSDRDLALISERLDSEMQLAMKLENELPDLMSGRKSVQQIIDQIYAAI